MAILGRKASAAGLPQTGSVSHPGGKSDPVNSTGKDGIWGNEEGVRPFFEESGKT